MGGDVMGEKGMRGDERRGGDERGWMGEGMGWEGGEGMLEDEGEEVLSRVYLDVTQT